LFGHSFYVKPLAGLLCGQSFYATLQSVHKRLGSATGQLELLVRRSDEAWWLIDGILRTICHILDVTLPLIFT
jgi:hypothetical protein